MEIKTLFLLFIIYSFLGWFMEIIIVFKKENKFINRGFLIGPICPIYGYGALLITISLTKYYNDIPVLFILATILGASLEYFTSYVMEKIFKTRWWDYSDHKYNINGRISLTTSIGFGILGVILVHFLNPFFKNVLTLIPSILLTIIAVILLIILITDYIMSFNIISNIKKIDLGDVRDATDEINNIVRDTLKRKSIFTRRLINAFPNLRIKIKKEVKKIENKIEKNRK